MHIKLSSLEATQSVAASLSQCLEAPLTLFFYGDLGAGKTTFIRAFLQAAGVQGRVKSPTYTLVEPYELDEKTYYHFDLYRLEAPEALDAIGISDYFSKNSICLFEWPERGGQRLPKANIIVKLQYPPSAESHDERACEIIFDNAEQEAKFSTLLLN